MSSVETPADDQLAQLRKMVAARGPAARVVAVTSGKGGVGKTNLSVNLAVAAAALGRRVIVIDLDLGLANADVVLGVQPVATLAHVLAGRIDVADALISAHGIHLLAGASGLPTVANLPAEGRDRLHAAFDRLERRADLIILDTGAGIARNVLEFAAAADETIIVTTPEPTALVDAYATLKLLSLEPDAGPLRVLVNMAESRQEAERVSAGIVSVAHRFLNARVDRIGYVLKDDVVGQAVRARAPFVVAAPRSAAAGCVRNLARRVLGAEREANPKGFMGRLLGFLKRGA